MSAARVEEQGSVDIFVRMPDGSDQTARIDTATTVADLFEEGDYFVTFRGRLLEDAEPLSKQGVVAGSTLHYIERRRGGALDDDLPTSAELGLPAIAAVRGPVIRAQYRAPAHAVPPPWCHGSSPRRPDHLSVVSRASLPS